MLILIPTRHLPPFRTWLPARRTVHAQRDLSGPTPLVLAAQAGLENEVGMLLKVGADINHAVCTNTHTHTTQTQTHARLAHTNPSMGTYNASQRRP